MITRFYKKKPASTGVGTTDQKPGMFDRFAVGLTKSSSQIMAGMTGLFDRRKLDDAALEMLETILLQADVGPVATDRIITAIADRRYEKAITSEAVKSLLVDEIVAIMAPCERAPDFTAPPHPRIVLFVGVNGSGKTTTIGKIAAGLGEGAGRALLVAGDTFRAAAVEQLTVWGRRANVPVLASKPGADAAGLVHDAMARARAEALDLVLIDTAGRLHNKDGLMAELEKIMRVIGKIDRHAPHDVILVLDATVGQNAHDQVRVFRERANVSGLVMTKLDGTARGGILVSLAERHALPIHLVGMGEGAGDLHPFSARAYARALIGVGDAMPGNP